MDDLPAHKVTGLGRVIEGAGASLRYLLLHSPDFSPISILRKAAARTVNDLWAAITDALAEFQPTSARTT